MTHPYLNPSLDVESRVADLLGRMTLAEKIGQMTQAEKNSITPQAARDWAVGSVLSGGGGNPSPNNPKTWRAMVQAYLDAALETRLAIPLIYGVDAVHGHNNVVGATIFPHNIGLGAARDPALVERIGRATAVEVAATNVRWTFAPAVSVPQDIRWGRTYEGYGENTELVAQLGAALVRGLHGEELAQDTAVLATAKHFLADGGTKFGTSRPVDPQAMPQFGNVAPDAPDTPEHLETAIAQGVWQLDQGVADISEAELRAVHLPPYLAAMEAGALSIMVSFSSWGGLKMHAQKYLLTEVLKGELGFRGFLISDWGAIDQLDRDYIACIAQSINAGLDMIMVPYHYENFITTLTRAAENGDVSLARIDDAVRRILQVKFALGLFDRPHTDPALLGEVGSAAHRALAREAVRKSAVLLKNEGGVLPLSRSAPRLLVAGRGADDLGYQCGGWTIEWMGQPGQITNGTTILEGIRAAVAGAGQVIHAPDGDFAAGVTAGVGIVVLAEEPYAEGMGDRFDLTIPEEDVALVERVKERCQKVVVILLSGRPLIVTEPLANWDAFVAAWWPGTEGNGLSDLLFGDYPFTGKLSYTWPRSMAQIPRSALREGESLFPYGYGL
ncbi:MAG: glycoside hydrolase family 3 C-terminal domain-containing protein [Chloroflexi bacterium]|nr:glycoside hydrolase family 3 C-terminal domain-containing protein [Chloroflexota bacterium]MCI0730165.1 glycoside hydrolase family 3 C-terminal domain-containing protein [Chloroflexota bacterium]